MGHYQDLHGERGCRAIPVEASWALIEPHLQPGWVVFDIGSDLGWFTRAASDKGCLAVGFEQSERGTDLAVELAGDWPIMLVRHRIEQADLDGFAESINTIDAVLALNVLHYLSWDAAAAWVKSVAEFAHTLIVEMPETTEATTTGHIFSGRIEELLRLGYPNVSMLGEHPVGPTHSRQIWLARRDSMFHASRYNDFSRHEGIRAQSPHRHGLLYAGGDWWITKRDQTRQMIRGLSVGTMLYFDVRYPSRQWFAEQAELAALDKYEARGQIDNVAPISFLWAGDHLEMIDCDGKEKRWRQDLRRTQRVLMDWSVDTYVRLWRRDSRW